MKIQRINVKNELLLFSDVLVQDQATGMEKLADRFVGQCRILDEISFRGVILHGREQGDLVVLVENLYIV